MNTADISLTVFILWIFGTLHAFSTLMLQMNKIKNNWSDYRCKPAIMPFANILAPPGQQNVMTNFSYCIKNIGMVFAGDSLSSLNSGFEATSSGLGGASTGLGTISAAMGGLKDSSKNNTGSTFSIFGNIAMQVQRFFDDLKSTMSNVTTGSHGMSSFFTSASKGVISGVDNVMHAITHVPLI